MTEEKPKFKVTYKMCPFCKGLHCRSTKYTEGFEWRGTYVIHCYGCGAEGPKANSKQGAWEKWNSRWQWGYGPDAVKEAELEKQWEQLVEEGGAKWLR